MKRNYLKVWDQVFCNPEKKQNSGGSEMGDLLTLKKDSKCYLRYLTAEQLDNIEGNSTLHVCSYHSA
jgi:hypothetical protein